MNKDILYKSIPFSGRAVDVLHLFKDEPGAFLMESSLANKSLGRYSFIGFDPFAVFKSDDSSLSRLRKKFQKFPSLRDTSITPFPAGIMGYLSYELGSPIERRAHRRRSAVIPSCHFGFYDRVITIDNYAKRLIISSTGLPEREAGRRTVRARERLAAAVQKIDELNGSPAVSRPLIPSQMPQALKSNFTKSEYCRAVKKALAYIRRGDIYQVNLSQRFCLNTNGGKRVSPFALYQSLRNLSPSCFGAYLDGGRFQIISSSPERFLHLRGRTVQTRPMKGTRPRGRERHDDVRKKRELQNSVKDQAELLMITDLERNDLGRVCEFGTVRVRQMRAIESYRTVFQATSTIEGQLKKERDAFDLLAACFPGGSITGCPKLRAMQIIAELEPSGRSVYTGSLGYISFSGNMDFNVLIRTLLLKGGKVYFHVGGGIVADSLPESEYEETLVKARAMKECLVRV